ncbi:helix-turn-helix transcriptional regulator [Levilactobacillus brevis]
MYRLTLKIIYCKRPVRHTFCFAKVCLTALEKRALRSPFYPPESQTQNRVDLASLNVTKVKPVKPSLFFVKKVTQKSAQKKAESLLFANRLFCALWFRRVEKGLTQSDVARISGLSTSMISKIESQYTVPSVKNFLTIYFRLRFGLGTCS